jgi:hypothetical protein
MCRKMMPSLTKQQVQKFWRYGRRSSQNECWLWSRSTNKNGYGFFFVGRRNSFLAHRIAYYIHYQKDPGESDVLHKCDTTGCVNPFHLFLGTHTDNMQDMVKKGRAKRQQGSKRPQSKLTEEIVDEIRSITPYWGITADLARKYNVNRTTIGKVLRGKKWKHV